jgi:molybdopterin converting factor small subunit
LVIKVHLHTILQRQSSTGNIRYLEIKLPPGSKLADLLLLLDITMNQESIILVVNGKLAEFDTLIMDKDVVDLIPAISGGR